VLKRQDEQNPLANLNYRLNSNLIVIGFKVSKAMAI
jgi:hypothetical protein